MKTARLTAALCMLAAAWIGAWAFSNADLAGFGWKMDRLVVKAQGGLTIDMDATYDFADDGTVKAAYKYKYSIDQGGTNTVDIFVDATADGFYAASDDNLTIHLDRNSIRFDSDGEDYRVKSQTSLYDRDTNLEMMMEKQMAQMKTQLQDALAQSLSQPMRFTDPTLKGKKLTLTDSDGSKISFKRK